jgi:hypothetical protein
MAVLGLVGRGAAFVGSRLLRNNRIASTVKTGVALGAAAAVGYVAANFNTSNLGTPKRPDPYKGTSAWFPIELEEIDHWIEFTAVETEGRALSALNSFFETQLLPRPTIGGTIRLPMPSNLSTDYNPDYSVASLGPVAGMLLKPAEQAMYGLNSMGGAAAAGQSLAGLVGGNPGTIANILAGTGTAAAVAGAQGAAGADLFGAALKVAGGVAVNPHKIVLFTGVNFREHQFTWKLSPKNREESNRIKAIIDSFVYYSHPQYVAGGLFFKYPEYFNIKFRHPEYLFELLPSVCKDVRVNYHGQGYPGYIRDSDGMGPPAPAEVELSLTFQEIEIVTKDNLKVGAGLNTGGTFRTTPVVQNPGGGPSGVGG